MWWKLRNESKRITKYKYKHSANATATQQNEMDYYRTCVADKKVKHWKRARSASTSTDRPINNKQTFYFYHHREAWFRQAFPCDCHCVFHLYNVGAGAVLLLILSVFGCSVKHFSIFLSTGFFSRACKQRCLRWILLNINEICVGKDMGA